MPSWRPSSSSIPACRLTRLAVEHQLGAPFALPGDLERVMASFQGSFFVDENEARWTAERAGA